MNKRKRSIRAQFSGLVIIVSLLTIIGAVLFFYFKHSIEQEFLNEQAKIDQTQTFLLEIDSLFNESILRQRGYLSFKYNNELEKGYQAGEELKMLLDNIDKSYLTNEEKETFIAMKAFLNRLFDEILPKAVEYVKKDDYESLKELSSSGPTNSIYTFRAFIEDTVAKYNQIQIQNVDRFSRINNLVDITLVVFVIFILVSTYLLTRKISNRIAEPIVTLAHATEGIAEGKNIDIPKYKQNDELGVLSNSFIQMVKKIQTREEELASQNEELTIQQEELINHQDKINQSLKDISYLNNALNESAIVAITDSKGVITFVNEKFCEISKYKKEELLGRTHRLINSDYHPKEFFKNMWAAIKKGRVWKGEVRNRSKDGSFYWVDTTIVPYLDEEGKPYQFIAVRYDITPIKATEEQLTKSLDETNNTKKILTHYNNLHHTLSVTLDKQELLEQTLRTLDDIFKFDKGLLFMMESLKHSSLGISNNQVQWLTSQVKESMIPRLLDTHQPHIVERESTLGEQGIEENPLTCYDLYVPVFNAAEKLIAVFISTRIGHPYNDVEIYELQGVLNQISLSIDRISLYEETEKARQLNQDIIDNINEGVQLISNDGELLQFNNTLARFFNLGSDVKGTEINEWSSLMAKQISQNNDFIKYLNQLLSYENSETHSFQYEIEKVGESNQVIDVYAQKLYQNESKFGTILVHRDVTKEHEIDQMKSDLVSTVSHELRTPLASVLGFTELMLNRELKPERQKKYLITIHKEAKRLTNLINDFLDLQRLESGRQVYEKKEIDLKELAEEVIDGFSVNNPSHDFSIKSDTPHTIVMADKEKMTQVYMNIISNAVKFSPKGGHITITFTGSDQSVFVHIADEGLGIPESEIPKLFTKFHRIDSSNRHKIGGTGLGLSICKEIINAHGGDISVRSKLNEGSVFSISLPLVKRYNQHIEIEEESGKQLDMQKPTIVILEDDESLAMLLVEELRNVGFNVIHIKEGTGAFERIKKVLPDGVVVDLMLGEDISGWDVIEQLKKDERTSKIPIFISSALDEKVKGIEFEIDHYYTKPYPPNELTTTIKEIVLHEHEKELDVIHVPESNEK